MTGRTAVAFATAVALALALPASAAEAPTLRANPLVVGPLGQVTLTGTSPRRSVTLERDDIQKATGLLISDLEAPQTDHLRIVDTVTTLQNSGVEVRVVPLFAQPQNRRFFAELVGPDSFVAETSLVRPIESDELGLGGRIPWLYLALYLALGFALVGLLAANERLNGRLTVAWRTQ